MKKEAPHSYEDNYQALPFENILRQYRNQKIIEVFKKGKHARILEIGSGPCPLFVEYADFNHMVVIEPGKMFYNSASALAASNNKITLINDFFENALSKLSNDHFDVIVVGGFLHEIDDPDRFLKMLKSICLPATVIHSFVPNAKSFHRLLAFEAGIISSVYQYSENDKLFQRQTVFDIDSYIELFKRNGFSINECGTYFIKPFTHQQMHTLISKNVIDGKVLNGLNNMIKYMPDFGAEIFATCSISNG